MKIYWHLSWYKYQETIECIKEEIYFRREDVSRYSLDSGVDSMKYCIETNIDKFTKEELAFLYELLESKDTDNLIMAFEIIDKK